MKRSNASQPLRIHPLTGEVTEDLHVDAKYLILWSGRMNIITHPRCVAGLCTIDVIGVGHKALAHRNVIQLHIPALRLPDRNADRHLTAEYFVKLDEIAVAIAASAHTSRWRHNCTDSYSNTTDIRHLGLSRCVPAVLR